MTYTKYMNPVIYMILNKSKVFFPAKSGIKDELTLEIGLLLKIDNKNPIAYNYFSKIFFNQMG